MRSINKLLFILPLTLFSLIFGNQAVFAEDSLTLTVSTNDLSMNVLPGNFNSVSQTITASTSNIAGYTIKMATAGSSTDLINQSDDTLTIPTFTLPSGASSLPAGQTGDGYGYSTDGGSTYLPAPDPAGAPAEIFKTSTSGENDHLLTFGAQTPQDALAGSYVNSFTIYIVANLEPCAANSICYYGNNDDGTGTMEDQSATSNTKTTLMASNFSRSGYGFAGWNTAIDGTGANYGPSQAIVTGDLSIEGLQLYAHWIPSAGNLQEWHGCEAMNIGEITALTDTRDGNTYAIAKYADNNCWFMENLRLDLSDQNLEISALNTNNPTTDFMTAVNAHPASSNNFCTATNAACINQVLFNTNNTNRSLTPSYDANNASSSWYSYGDYYNWYTATAGHGTYSFSTTGATVSGDLCPAGWHLPTASANGNYAQLDIELGGNGANQISGDAGVAASERWRAYPLNYVYSGEQNGASAYNRNVSGGFNSSNAGNSAARTMNFWIRSTAINISANTTSRNRGQTIRCLATENYEAIGTIHYDANGGTGTMPDEVDVDLATAVAANNLFTKTSNEFVSWNTKADGTGTIVTEGGSVATAANDMGIVEGGTLTLYAIWRPLYSVVYDGNNADAGSMSNANHANYDPSGTLTLVPSNFSRAGYGFAGWSLDSSAASKLQNGENVTIYGPNQTIPAGNTLVSGADADNMITLYAVWLPATANMQSFGTSECSALSVGDVLALTDNRDNNSYAIAKLADGNCWMMEKLRLDPSAVTFTSNNTNSPTTDFVSAAPNSASENTLCTTNSSACIDKIAFNTNNINSSLTPSYTANNATSSWYSYGVLYNWYTVSAGNGIFAMSSGNVAGDICPAGWRLPIGGTADVSEIVALNNSINNGVLNNDTRLRNYPNNFIYSGDYNGSKPTGRSTYARYWTSTASNANTAYRFGFTTSDVTPVRAWNKWVAFTARCIVKSANN